MGRGASDIRFVVGAFILVVWQGGTTASGTTTVPPGTSTLSAAQGHRAAVVLFGGFADSAGPAAVPAWARDFFDPARPGSFSHFYDTMSHGRLRVRGEVAPSVYRSRRPVTAFLADTHTEAGAFGDLVWEMLTAADRDVDFSRFDNDGPDGLPASGDDDGAVDLLIVILPEVPANLLLGPATGIASLGFDEPFVTDDSGPSGPVHVDPNAGTVQQGRTFAEAVGHACHEFGHVLGLPDLFDTDFVRSPQPLPPERDSAGIGAWGLMGWGAQGWNGDDGPNSFSAWSLAQLGWARVQQLTEAEQSIALPDVGQRGDVLEIGVSAGERFLVEHRRRNSSYYDRNLPGEGLLIWRVLNDPRRSGPIAVTLESADGRWRDAGFPLGAHAAPVDGGTNLDFWAHDADYASAHAGNLGDATDPFDGGRFARFTPETNPSSASRTGGLPARVEGIHVDGDSVRFRVTSEPPSLRIVRLDVQEYEEGALASGRKAGLVVQLENSGGIPLTDVRVEATSPEPVLHIDTPVVDFGTLQVGTTTSVPGHGFPRLVLHPITEDQDLQIHVRVSSAQTAAVDTTLSLRGVALFPVQVRVTDDGGQPVDDVLLSVSGRRLFSARTDSEGHLDVDLPAGGYEFTVLPTDGSGLFRLREWVTVERPTVAELIVQRGLRLVGVVRSHRGVRVPFAAVDIGGEHERCDQDGQFRITVAPGRQTVVLEPPEAQEERYGASVVRFIDVHRDTFLADLRLAEPVRVMVEVMADGEEPEHFIRLRPLIGSPATVPEDGSGLLVARGIYLRTVLQRTGRFQTRHIAVPDVAWIRSDTTLLARVTNSPFVGVRGRLVQTGAVPAFDARVRFRSLDGARGHSLQPATDGSFVEEMLEPGRYEVTLEDVHHGTAPGQIVDTVLLPSDEPVVIEPMDGVEVRGLLLDASGAPLAAATLHLVSAEAGAWTETVTDEAGGFARHLLPGSYAPSTRVGVASHRLSSVRLPGEGEIVLRLPARQRLAGRIDHPWGDDVLLAAIDDPLSLFDLEVSANSQPERTIPLAEADVAIGMVPDGIGFELTTPPRDYLVAFGRNDGIGLAMPMNDADPESLDVVLPDIGVQADTLYGAVRAPDGGNVDDLLLRFYNETTGIVLQVRDWLDGGGLYVAVLPAGEYAVRAAVPHSRLGLGATYDLGRVQVRGTRRWDIQLQERQTSVAAQVGATPAAATLARSYPNPFNATTVIEIRLPRSTEARLAVYNVLGQPVRELVRGKLAGGKHRIVWDGRDTRRVSVATGVYFSVLEADGSRLIQRMLLVR